MQEDLSNIQVDARCQNLTRVIEQFVHELNVQAGKKHATAVISRTEVFDGSKLGQKPERFIEIELIDPVLRVLGYEPLFQPTGFNGLEGQYPDFTARNLEITNLGEVKKPGAIRNARKESYTYITDATDRPILGIATDGLVWILHTGSEPGELPTCTAQVDIQEIFDKVRLEQCYDRADRRSRIELRGLAQEFVRKFSRDSVVKHVVETQSTETK
ncbi:hypothetical protein AB7C87_17005 [Natrarchaeobius sp. A-rgal3]|uniref:hypothetical protein n=1 Tax=Natrarchaeobius versutus TaxID=1679078 RepID=UPI003510B2A4